MLSETIKQKLTDRFAASPADEFHKRRIVFWRDEDGEFAEQVEGLDLPGVTIVKLTGKNNFAAKKLLSEDDLMGDFLVYDSLAYGEEHEADWLSDVKKYSEEFKADLVSIQMDELRVEPSSVMRKTMKVYTKFLDNKERRAKLRKIGRTYKTPLQLHIDIMAILCGLNGGTAQDVIIAVLSGGFEGKENPALLNIEKNGNIEAFWKLAQHYTGYIYEDGKTLIDFASHVLIAALSQTLNVGALKGLERFVSESGKAYCYQLVHEWQRGEKREQLEEICRRIESELKLVERFDNIDIGSLLKSDTFPAINESILKHFFDRISEQVIKPDAIFEAVENRRTAAWYYLTAEYFDCLYFIAQMQEFYISHTSGFHIVEPKGLWSLYTDDAYLMDSHYRHFHYSFGNTLTASNPKLEDALKKCSDVVENLYHQWYLKELTGAWTKAIAGDLETLGYVSEIKKQRWFFNDHVSTIVDKGKRVYVVVSDALRFEVAAELTETLNRSAKGGATIESMQAIFPGVTKYGMAALLPGKTISVNEKQEVLVDGKQANSTVRRAAILNGYNSGSVAVIYRDFLQMKKQERRDLVADKEIVYIYHDAIDAIGDKAATETKVFEACNTAIVELSGIVRMIVNDLRGANIFITADHGFLYTYKALEENNKISRQTFDGEVYELERRYALVSPETVSDLLLPVNMGRELEGVTMRGYAPQETIRIKVKGGGANYVHGGISLQEMVVPVIVYKDMRTDSKKYVEVQNPGLSLISESRKVSNLIFPLDFLQKQAVGDKVQPCSYTLQLLDEDSIPVSDTQVVIADKTSANASERVFRVKFTLKSIAFDRNKYYRLYIANGTDIPEEIDFNVDIAFADDFGFDL